MMMIKLKDILLLSEYNLENLDDEYYEIGDVKKHIQSSAAARKFGSTILAQFESELISWYNAEPDIAKKFARILTNWFGVDGFARDPSAFKKGVPTAISIAKPRRTKYPTLFEPWTSNAPKQLYRGIPVPAEEYDESKVPNLNGQSFTPLDRTARDFATDWGYNDTGVVLVVDNPIASNFIISPIWSILLGDEDVEELETFGVKNMRFKAVGTTYEKFFKIG